MPYAPEGIVHSLKLCLKLGFIGGMAHGAAAAFGEMGAVGLNAFGRRNKPLFAFSENGCPAVFQDFYFVRFAGQRVLDENGSAVNAANPGTVGGQSFDGGGVYFVFR